MTLSPTFGTAPAAWMEDPYLTLDDLARYAGLSRRTLEKHIRDPVHPIRAYRVGKAVRVRKSDYDRWIAERQVAPVPASELTPDDVAVLCGTGPRRRR